MTETPFLSPKLTGDRFNDHSIPLELLKDLSVLEEMITEVAKAEYLKDHEYRQRCPRGFTDGISLKLSGIDDGSAIAIISLLVTMTSLFPPENQKYFERARDAMVNAIAAAEQNHQITDFLTETSLSYFDRIGRSLRDGEAMEFAIPARQTVARLTKETRRKLVLASSSVKILTEEVRVRGTVPELDQDDMTFEIQLIDGRKIRAPLAAPHLKVVLEATTGYQTGTRVMLQGIGRFDRKSKLLGFDSIEGITILDPLDISARLDELQMLKAGWLDGDGAALSLEGLSWISEAFERFYPDDLPLPYLYPTPEGGIQAEWTIGQNDISLKVDLESRLGSWYTVNLVTHEDEVRDLKLAEGVEWGWMVAQIQGMSEGIA